MNQERNKELFAAINSGDEAAIKEAMNAFTTSIQNEVITNARQTMDAEILANRTGKALTSQEREYFNAVITKKTFDGVDKVLPQSIFNTVFDRLKESHSLVSLVDVKNTQGLLRLVTAKPNMQVAQWGKICADIREMIPDGFEERDLRVSKLSGFVPVCKGMLELGPEWLAEYVITIMTEIMLTALENAIVNGTGKEEPVGMMKSLVGAVDGKHNDKKAVAVTDLSPKSMGKLRAELAKAKADKGEVSLVVNPATYWEKVFPELAIRNANGVWVNDVLATGETIVTSYAVPEGKAILGNLKNYLLAVASDTKINAYDQTLAIEDCDLYIAKFFGTGTPKFEEAFKVLDLAKVGVETTTGK